MACREMSSEPRTEGRVAVSAPRQSRNFIL